MKKIILSIQHLLAMFGATVLVPLLTGFDPSVAIFCAGVGTLLFHKCTDFKVPVFLGSSFAFISLYKALMYVVIKDQKGGYWKHEGSLGGCGN